VEGGNSDFWRFGVLLYELTVGFPPFRSKTHDPAELAQAIMGHRDDTIRFPPFVSAEAQDLIRQVRGYHTVCDFV